MRWSAVLGALVLVGGYVGCGFPNYTYDDNAFYDAGVGGGSNGGSGGAAASAGSAGKGGGSAGKGGGSAGKGGGSAGTAGTGGGTGKENCNNGKDDDGDGMIDCADPDCQNAGYACRTIPSGWQGPVALYTGDNGKTPPVCPVAGNYNNAFLTAYLDPSVPATCQCSCGAPTGVSCGGPYALLYSAASCGAGNTAGLDFSGGGGSGFGPGSCVKFSGAADAGAFASKSANVPNPVPASGGSCTPGQVVVGKPDPWKQEASACQGPAGGWQAAGCGTGQLCAPPAPSGFNHKACIWKQGDVACPSPSVFSNQIVVYNKNLTTDSRGCTPCQCDPPKGNCSGKVELWSTSSCAGTPDATVDFSGSCKPFVSGNTLYGDYKLDAAQSGVTCAVSASGGKPTGTGTVTPANPTTFCCTN